MGALILDSLEIRNFRAFRHLQIERLGRVNLVVGKNNVGKTCLLEGLRLYAQHGSPTLILQLLAARDEIGPARARDAEDDVWNIKYLFHGRKNVTEQIEPIHIGPINSQDNLLSITPGFYVQIEEEGGLRRKLQPLQTEEYATVENPILGLAVQVGLQPKVTYRLDRYWGRKFPPPPEPTEIRSVFIAANGLGDAEISALWDGITLTDLEQDVFASLRIVASDIQDFNLVGSNDKRIAKARITGLSEPIPLRSFGEGMNRILGIALALVNAKDGLLLIDEVESGLHYSIQPDMWRLVFQVAQRLNIQVFATTHSWDCIASFQKAVQANENGEGLLVRLEHKKDAIVASVFDKRKLGIATREDIEVR